MALETVSQPAVIGIQRHGDLTLIPIPGLRDSMAVTIRPFQYEELARVKEITVEAFDGVSIDRNIEDRFGRIQDRDWKWRKARHLDQDAVRDPDGIYVAEQAGTVVGYSTTWCDREAGIGHIPNLAVDRRWRGQGIGRQLIEHALSQFRAVGMTLARIETLEQNTIGRTLYPDLGFEEVARQVHYCLALDSGHNLDNR